MSTDFSEVHLFPKRQTLLGIGFLITITILILFLISHMWNALQTVNQHHFPLVERSSINVRLVNIINYQFDLLKSSRSKEERVRLLGDLNLNFQTLEQNYIHFQSKMGLEPDLSIFLTGKEILLEFEKKTIAVAQRSLKEKKFLEQLDAFAFSIYDSTETMSEQRDTEMDVIEKIIFNTSIVAFLFLIFLAYLMRQIYHKYGLNLTERLYAEKTATELSRQRQSLIHILCHDLGNPLSAIYGLIKSAHLLPEEERSNILVTIEENTKESLEVIEITKKMQAIESGKLEIALRPTSLKTCLLKSLEVLASQIEAKAINIETSQLIEQSVMADATCLTHSIFNNIISNAIKFSPHGAAITLEISDTSPKFSTVTITDQGQGIPPKLLKAVFSDSVATTRKGTAGEQGTGFGMPIVKKMMDALGGKIEIQSPVSEQKQGVKIELTFLKALSS